MLDNIIKWLFSLKLFKNLRDTTAPRWLILLIDMFLVTCAFLLTVLSDIYATSQPVQAAVAVRNWLIFVAAYLVVSLLTRSYSFIIRLSVIEDLYRVFVMVFLSSSILLLVNLVHQAVTTHPLFRFWNIIYVGVTVFALLTIERLVIKHIYSRFTSTVADRLKVLVLGTSLDSLILANALKSEIGGKYEPVGLLSTSPDEKRSMVNGFKVYTYEPEETLADLFASRNFHALLFSQRDARMMSGGLADFFIKQDIKLLLINHIEEFDTEQQDGNISHYIKEVQIEDLLGREPIVLNNTLVRSNINGNVVLITGACGSIGSEIVRQVAAYKASKIILVDQAETPMHDLSLELRKSYPNAEVVLFMGDVQNYARMEEAFKTYRPRFVFHAAAYKHVPMMELNPTEAVLTNVEGTRNVADLALKYGVFKFVMISTDKAVNPSNIMGCTKRLAEIYCQSLFFDARQRGLHTQFITTRFGNVLGSNGSVIPLFRRQIAAGGPLTVTHRDIIRYFMTIPEACSLVLEAGCMGHGGEIYIFDMGEPVRIYDLAERMISLAGLRPHVDIKIEEIGLRPGEKLFEELLNDKETTIATDNDKIMIAKVRRYEYTKVCESIDFIIGEASAGNIHDMVTAMKRFVPEYKSMHSEYEAIDAEIEHRERSRADQVTPPAPM